MNCSEVRELAPLYLSGELEGMGKEPFDSHLGGCPDCARALDECAWLDARLRIAIDSRVPDTAGIDARIMKKIEAGNGKRWRYAAAAIIVMGTVLSYSFSPGAPLSRPYLEALRDHRAEVVQHQPRRWRSGIEDIGSVAARFNLSGAQLASLAPSGYRLEHAKICGIAGEPALHLVYTDGSRETSVFIRRNGARVQWDVRRSADDREYVDGLRTERYSAVIITTGSRRDCLPFERSVSRIL